MCRLMTFITSLLLSLSAGSATYAAGAIMWCTIDPEGAGAKLLFTIPVALAGMAVPGILGALCLAFRCDFIPEPRTVKAIAPTPAPAPRRPVRTARPQIATSTATDLDELALAT